MAEIAFRRVRGSYGWLGNMSPHPILHMGAVYPTAEHLFQCWRFVGPCRRWPGDGDWYGGGGQWPPNHPYSEPPGYWKAVEEVRALRSPMAAKMRAKALRDLMVVTPRSEVDVENMRRVLGLKLAQHPDLAAALLETGGALIVEDCSARPSESGLFWGARTRTGGWDGQNVLGRLWMGLRAELHDAMRQEASGG